VADYTFSPAVVVVESTGVLAIGATGVLRPPDGGASVPVYDLNDSLIPNVAVGPLGDRLWRARLRLRAAAHGQQ
jgi:hypothetical protein